MTKYATALEAVLADAARRQPKWVKLGHEKYGYDGSVAVLNQIGSPEAIGAFDLRPVPVSDVIDPGERPQAAPLNADGMTRRGCAISRAEWRAEHHALAVTSGGQWFRAKVRGTYWENCRQYGIDRTVYLCRLA